jgi:hypothetical protein
MRRWTGVVFALAAVLLASGHVGTDDVFFAGSAGAWDVRVTVRSPGVIPGLADISVRVAQPGVDRVLVTARELREGMGHAPPPDIAEPVRGESDLHASQLWLMVRGSYEVIVTVEGARGTGVARIPIVARATKQLAMSRTLAAFVFASGVFLIVGLLTLFGAAARESVLQPGENPSPADRRRGRRTTAIAAVTLALVLFGGWTWIRAEARAHRERLDRPWDAEASTRTVEGARMLDFAITDPLWVNRDNEEWRTRNQRYRRSDIIPDHGKMMHMFVVREPGMDAFAHIHPVRLDDSHFTVPFPPLPAGTYRVYADITHEDGFAHTLYSRVVVGDGASATDDPDDAWWVAPAAGGSTSSGTAALKDGSALRWLNAGEPLVAGADAELVFRVEDAAGDVVALDPYMGMQGHAMLNREDGDVFVHLHPGGTISMAAYAVLGDAGMPAGMHADADGAIRFPLVVPEAGRCRIWVQVRRGAEILTGAFDTEIRAR